MGTASVGPFNILTKLGQGSSAMFYEARHKKSQRDFAIKVIKKDDSPTNPKVVSEFQVIKIEDEKWGIGGIFGGDPRSP